MLLCPTWCSSPTGVRDNVAVRAARRRASRRCSTRRVLPVDAVHLPGRLLTAGCVNAHSHAFQRALRGRVERARPGARRRLLVVAPGDVRRRRRARPGLDPRGRAGLLREARAAGYTAVGEFHYVHHQPDGTPYDDPNALALAVIDAARAPGSAIVLLLAAYARAGADRPAEPGQRRFCDDDV